MKYDIVLPLRVLAKWGAGSADYQALGYSSLYFLALVVYIIHLVGARCIVPLLYIEIPTLFEKKTNRSPNRQHPPESVVLP